MPFAHADDVYGRVILTDGTRTNGVEVRRTDSMVAFATSDGILTVPPGRVTLSVGMTRRTAEINQLLSFIQRAIREKQFYRIENDLTDLQALIDDFERSLRNDLSSAVVTEQQKSAIRHAIAYYRQEVASVGPTIKVVELSEVIQRLHGQFRMGQVPRTRESLMQLIELQGQLDAIEQATPLADRERATAAEGLMVMLTAVTAQLREQVLGAYSRRLDIQPVVEHLRTLAMTADRHTLFDQEQKAILDGVLATASSRATRLPELSRQVLLVTDNGLVYFADQYNELRQGIEQQVLPSLVSLRQALFGQARNDHLQRVDLLIGALRASIETTAGRVSALGEVSRLSSQAVEALQARSFEHAIALYEQATELLAKVQMGETPVYELVGRELMRGRALHLKDELERADRLPPALLDSLLARSRSFLADNQQALDDIEVSRREFASKIEAVDLYVRYLSFMERLELLRQQNPMDAWNYLLQVNASMQSRQGSILPAANRHWEAYLLANEERIFQAANEDFFARGEGLGDPGNRDTFLSFIKKFIHDADFQKALDSIDKALAAMSLEETGETFMNELLNLKLEIAMQFERGGQPDLAVATYQEMVQPRFVAFATRRNIRQNLARAKLKLAEVHAQEGKYEQAVALYEAIAADSPAFAAEQQLVRRALELATLRFEHLEDALEAEELLVLYERYSELFPGQVRTLPQVRQLLTSITDRFQQHWRDDQPELALQHYQEFRESYPSLSREIGLARQLLLVVRNRMHSLASPTDAAADAAAARASSQILDAAAVVLRLPELRDESQLPVAQERYVSVLMQRAENFLTVGQVERAYAVYDQVIREFPVIAEERQIEQIKQDKLWDLRMEKVRRPLGIKSGLDWTALVAWLIIWGGFFLYANRRGKRLGDRKYRMHHFVNVFGVFFGFLILFLFFDLAHSEAFTLAFVLPGVLFNGLGITTYRFFPLIYHERRLLLQRAVLHLIKETPLRAATSDTARANLTAHVGELQKMVSLMHDRQLFEIHMAIRYSERDPVKGSVRLEQLLAQFEQVEQVRRNAVWRDRHAMIVHQLGLIAHQQNDYDKGMRYLLAYIEHNPKDVDVRLLVGDMAYDVGDHEGAIPHLKVSLAAHGQDEQLWLKLGRCFFATEKYVAAYKCFEAAKHKNRDILFWGARAFARAGERERAAKWYQALLKKHANDTEAVYYLAATFAEMGQYVKAIKVASVIKEDDLRYPAALTLQGHILFKRDEFQKADVFYQKALELDADFIPALVGSGQIKLASGKADEALRLFSHTIDLQPAHPGGNYFLGVLLQEKAPERAIEHLKKAVPDAAFTQWAARRIAYIAFFLKDSDTALQYFEVAEGAGESSPWFLFLFAYTLASRRELRRCEQILIKILGRATQSKDWSPEAASQAMYSIGVMLFEQHAYKMAHQCFECVRENPLPNADLTSVASFLEEARFRMVVNWLEQGEYIEAQARCAELQQEAVDKSRYRSCQYYVALCHLYQGQYAEAASVLDELVAQQSLNPRYRYHQIIARLGCGKEKEAREAMNAFAGMSGRPAHLAAGLVTIQAYVSASRGKVQDAERSLARVSLPSGDSVGDSYLREKIILARIYFLCQLQDYQTIAELVPDLPDEQRAKALYMEAISCLHNGDYQRAIEFMRPFADKSERDRKLFLHLSSQLAISFVQGGNRSEARRHLLEIPKPPREVTTILSAWDVSEKLSQASNVDQLDELLQVLKGNLGKMEDEYLNYFVLHNLAVLYLRRACFAEDHAVADVRQRQCWTEAIDFWYSHVFTSPGYWNLAQARFAEDPKKSRPFAAEDIEKINQAAKDQYCVNTFMGLVLHYLSSGDETGVNRHLDLLHLLAQRDGKLKAYYRRLGEKAELYLRSIDKSNPLWNNWDFSVASLDLQVRIAAALGLDHSSASEQLELYRKTRQRYHSPAEYQRAKRHFNTELLETIQVGVRGSFGEAGDLIDKILANVPPGIDLAKVEENLRLLREACKNPAAYAERGVNLSQQFEKVYAAARTIGTAKGKP